ncbi:MAG: thiamine pyrophosphate-dependent enzyme, partial [Eggerthellaceae bacterium]|nr:thiamine pyrophosphate-dependent enzyme [Eggerthellaceae bacterium]
QVPIVGDLKGVLEGLVEQLEKDGAKPNDEEWLSMVFKWKERYPFYHPDLGDSPDEIVPEVVLQKLSDMLDPENSIVVTEVGQHQMWSHQFIDRQKPRTFISSGGLGTMGFGFPAAIGAAIAEPDKTVVCIAGDGSFQMNLQEMATAIINKVPVKILIMDNRCLGMVHQWQKLFYNNRFSQTELEAVPDFVKLAEAYGWEAQRITHPDEVDGALAKMLASKGPYLLDVVISRDQNVYPMVAPGAALDNIMGAIDVAVGAVRTDLPSAPSEPDENTPSPCAKIDAQFGGRWENNPEDDGPRLSRKEGLGK